MKKLLPLLALVALPACIGGGDGVDTTPDVVTCSEIGDCLNSVRMSNGVVELESDATVSAAAQMHANDMMSSGNVSIFLDGTTTDMGDTLNSMSFSWNEIIQMVNQGDLTDQEMFAEWAANGSPSGSNGGSANDLDFALSEEDFDYFGLGKAGSGANQYWALIIVDAP